jgi:hypothetical protein
MRASMAAEVRGSGELLHGDVLPPVEVTGAIIDADTSADGTIELRMPDAAGSVTLSAYGVIVAELRAFTPPEVTALDVTADAPSLTPLATVNLAIDPTVEGRAVCGDTLSRTVTIETPTICELADGSTSVTSAGLADVRIRGLLAGVCNVRVDLAGTALTATKALTVTM